MNREKVDTKTPVKIVGKTTKRLFNAEKFYHTLLDLNIRLKPRTTFELNEIFKEALDLGVGEWYLFELLETCVKPMFKGNRLWKFIYKNFGKDLKITFITGHWTTNPIEDNLVTNAGLAIGSGQINGVTTAPVTAIAIGTGTTAANAADTALETEITTNGGQRGAATTSRETDTVTNDAAQWVKTFNFTGSFAVTEEGLLDNNTSGGNLLARQVFTAVNVVSGDSLQITHQVVFSTS